MTGGSRLWCGLVVLALAVCLAGAPGSPAAGAARTDVLIVAKDISDIRTPDPNKAYDVSGVFLQFPIYSRLVRQRAPDFWKVEPDLAESWSINPDASVYTFKLRQGVTFPSGMRNFVAKILLPAASPLKPCRARPRLKPQSLPSVVPVQRVEVMTFTPTPAARWPANCTGVALLADPSLLT